MEKKFVSYSSLLIDFIDSLITGEEDEQEFLDKAKLGQIAWNFNVSDVNELPYDDMYKTIFLSLTQGDDRLKDILNNLVLRKGLKYPQYNQFIFTLEIRTNKLGQKTLYAESAPVDIMK